jgi:hypothetical protein
MSQPVPWTGSLSALPSPHSSGDRALASGARCEGSNPSGGTAEASAYSAYGLSCRSASSKGFRLPPPMGLPVPLSYWVPPPRGSRKGNWLPSQPPVRDHDRQATIPATQLVLPEAMRVAGSAEPPPDAISSGAQRHRDGALPFELTRPFSLITEPNYWFAAPAPGSPSRRVATPAGLPRRARAAGRGCGGRSARWPPSGAECRVRTVRAGQNPRPGGRPRPRTVRSRQGR